MSDNVSEIPQSMRDLAEENIKRAHFAFGHLADFMTKTLGDANRALPSSVPAGFKDVRDRALDFAKDNAESTFTFAGKICNAKTPEELLTLQTRFAQDRMQAFTTQTQELFKSIGEALQKS